PGERLEAPRVHRRLHRQGEAEV
ncbi:hypothetical protein BN1708_018928, partial [Verticillium longisporum]